MTLSPEPKKVVALACDHRGVEMKETIKALLAAKGYGVVDCGTNGPESVDYPEFILDAATRVSQGTCWRAIGICYTGIGSSIVANKVRGVRASLVHSVEEARLTRAHNDSNMLIFGAGFLNAGLVQPIVEMWLTTLFEGGRHGERLRKIEDYENTH